MHVIDKSVIDKYGVIWMTKNTFKLIRWILMTAENVIHVPLRPYLIQAHSSIFRSAFQFKTKQNVIDFLWIINHQYFNCSKQTGLIRAKESFLHARKNTAGKKHLDKRFPPMEIRWMNERLMLSKIRSEWKSIERIPLT